MGRGRGRGRGSIVIRRAADKAIELTNHATRQAVVAPVGLEEILKLLGLLERINAGGFVASHYQVHLLVLYGYQGTDRAVSQRQGLYHAIH